MKEANQAWFTFEPIPHTDKGLIYCDGPVQFAARVTRFGYGKKFQIEYDGHTTDEITSILKQMDDWFYHTHIKDAEDNEF